MSTPIGASSSKCGFCDNEAVYQLKYTDRALCSFHFIRMFNKRFRDTVRLNSLISVKDNVIVFDDNSIKSKVLIHSLKELQKDFPFKLSVFSVASRKEFTDLLLDLRSSRTSGQSNRKLALPLSVEDFLLFSLGRILRKSKAHAKTLKENNYCNCNPPIFDIYDSSAKIILPLKKSPSKEIALYAKLIRVRSKQNFDIVEYLFGNCAFNKSFTSFLDEVETTHPGSLFRLYKSLSSSLL